MVPNCFVILVAAVSVVVLAAASVVVLAAVAVVVAVSDTADASAFSLVVVLARSWYRSCHVCEARPAHQASTGWQLVSSEKSAWHPCSCGGAVAPRCRQCSSQTHM